MGAIVVCKSCKTEFEIINNADFCPKCKIEEVNKHRADNVEGCNLCKGEILAGELAIHNSLNFHKNCLRKHLKLTNPTTTIVKTNVPLNQASPSFSIDTKKTRVSTSEALKFLAKEGAINTINLVNKATDTTKSILREASVRSGKYQKIDTEEEAYSIALEEIENNTFKKGLMAKAMALSEGNKDKQTAKYLELRAKQLIELTQDLGKQY